MKEQATRLRGWMRHHRVWSAFMLLALLAGMGVGVYWTVELVPFGLPPPTGQNCGSLQHNDFPPQDGTTRADATLQPLTRFWQAYQACRAATISQTLAGTDAGHTDTLTVEQRNNRCAIYGHEEWQVNTDSGTDTFLCNQLNKEGDDLQVSACDGAESFSLFARDPTRESYGCGVDDCFSAAYQQCLADSLKYITSLNGVETERDFYIDNHCRIAYWRGTASRPSQGELAACASLVMRDDGLHFSQCGTDGDIFVPLVPSS